MSINKHILTLSLFTGLLIATIGCSGEQANQAEQRQVKMERVDDGINYGSDVCEFTNKPIETVRYGGRIELDNGDRFTFMSVECLAGYYLGLSDQSAVKSIKAVDFAHGERLLPVDEMVFLHSKLRPSPNGLFLTAVDASNEKMKTYIYDAYPGPYLDWSEVLELVRDEWDLTESTAHSVMN